jgi:hypothetical protein
MVGLAINIRGIEIRYVLIGLLCLLVLQGCASSSGGGSSFSSGPVQGQNRDGGDHGGGRGR